MYVVRNRHANREGADSVTLQWWRDAVTYQVYVRSFADGNGDGVGDLSGIRSRLRYLADLGIDAIWLNPWYPSPMADGGYDVSDYRDIDPDFGTLDEADALIDEAHALGIRIIIDIVPNHVSDQHPWFQAALKAAPRSAERARFWFRPGRGPGGAEPPNNWVSHFGGPAWSRVTEADGSPGQWYLHLFADAQPDLNWEQPEVREEHLSILRFWFDRGTPPRSWSRTRSWATSTRTRRATPRIRTPTATASTRSTRSGGRWPTPTRSPRR